MQSNKLLKLLNSFDNNLFCTSDTLNIVLTKKAEARIIATHCVNDILALLNLFKLEYCEVRFDSNCSPYRVCRDMMAIASTKSFLPSPTFEPVLSTEEVYFMSDILQIPEIPQMFTGICRVTPAFRPYIDEILENPQRSICISRCSDNAQLIVNAKHTVTMNVSSDKAVSIRTDDYWLSSCIEELQRKYTEFGSTTFEHTYQCSNYVLKTDPEAPWVEMTVRYRLFTDEFNTLYRVGETLDVRDIRTPANVH